MPGVPTSWASFDNGGDASAPILEKRSGCRNGSPSKDLGGRKDLVPVLLESGSDDYYTCVANHDIAKRLAMHLFTAQVRVYGTGLWHREANGQWTLARFIIGSFDVLEFIQINLQTLIEPSESGITV